MISSRVTVDMERRIYYVLQQVRFTNQKYYLDWLQREVSRFSLEGYCGFFHSRVPFSSCRRRKVKR